MNPFERVQKLIALATNTGAPIDEQRNAALAAVKLLVEHKMLDQRAVPPAPPISGLGDMIGSMFTGFTADVILKSVGELAAGAGAMEILELRNKNLVLERTKVSMQREIERLHAQLLGKSDVMKPHRERRRRRGR